MTDRLMMPLQVHIRRAEGLPQAEEGKSGYDVQAMVAVGPSAGAACLEGLVRSGMLWTLVARGLMQQSACACWSGTCKPGFPE